MDIPADSADCLFDDWQKRNPQPSARKVVFDFIHQRCPKWSRYFDNGIIR